MPQKLKTAIFAGGCFWCMEPPYANLDGVEAAIAGYSGGSEVDASYYQVVSGKTDHREAIEIHYDPKKVDYATLVDTFWKNIDPTDTGGQFADRGMQYMTTIFYQNEEEQQIAEQSKQALQDSGKFDQPIATEILPFTSFYPAEEEQQQYYIKNPTHYQLYKEGSGRAGFLRENWEN